MSWRVTPVTAQQNILTLALMRQFILLWNIIVYGPEHKTNLKEYFDGLDGDCLCWYVLCRYNVNRNYKNINYT